METEQIAIIVEVPGGIGLPDRVVDHIREAVERLGLATSDSSLACRQPVAQLPLAEVHRQRAQHRPAVPPEPASRTQGTTMAMSMPTDPLDDDGHSVTAATIGGDRFAG